MNTFINTYFICSVILGLKHCLPTLRRDPSNAIEWLTNPSFVSIATYSTERLLEEIKKMPDFHAGNDDETHIGKNCLRHVARIHLHSTSLYSQLEIMFNLREFVPNMQNFCEF